MSIKSDYQDVLHIPIAVKIGNWYDQTLNPTESGSPNINCKLLREIIDNQLDVNDNIKYVTTANRAYQDALEELELAQDKLQASITNAENQFKNI